MYNALSVCLSESRTSGKRIDIKGGDIFAKYERFEQECTYMANNCGKIFFKQFA